MESSLDFGAAPRVLEWNVKIYQTFYEMIIFNERGVAARTFYSKTLGATSKSWEQLQNPGSTPKHREQFQNPRSSQSLLVGVFIANLDVSDEMQSESIVPLMGCLSIYLILYSVSSLSWTMYSVFCILCTEPFILYSVSSLSWTMYSVFCILCTEPCILYSVSSVLNHVSCILYPQLCIFCHIVNCVIWHLKQYTMYLDWIMYLVLNHLYLISRLDGTNVSGMDCKPVSNLKANLRTDSRRTYRTR